MKHIHTLVVAAGLTITMAAHANEPSWINLFDGESLFGWNQTGTAAWHVDDGAIYCEEGAGGLLATTSEFKDFELTLKVKVKEECSTGILVRASTEGHATENGSYAIPIREAKRGGEDWQELRVVAQGGLVTATLDGNEHDVVAGSNETGHIAFQYHHNNRAEVWIKDVKLRPLGLSPIFNGEDLSGWNIIPGRESEFAVVDGALNIKDGNGQIETDNLYRDFILQLDIISNGEHLNSGVFFRGPKGVFWKGYESQVRNQWRGDNRSNPIDYGTGGIYGNQPAREVVSSDYEWFTKTIVCKDNHMAVWIDGYLVSDFTDTRPPVTNGDGKAGYVPEAGTIHLQGHDPTTDLSFKNIILQEY